MYAKSRISHRNRWIPVAMKVFFITLLIASLGEANEPVPSNEELARRIEILTAEIERLKTGDISGGETKSFEGTGMGPSASKVYGIERSISIGGYGEIVYTNFAAENESGADSGRVDMVDALRLVMYLGYRFSDKIVFNSEIEFEHANEVYAEFYYVDFLLSRFASVRAGLLLIPMGFINELHESPLYLGAARPLTEQYIIPTTWREIGAGLHGSLGDFSYRVYGVNSLDGVDFTSNMGLRKGRQNGTKAKAEDFALAARIDYVGLSPGVVGASLFYGKTGQDSGFSAPVFVVDGHADYRFRGFQLRGVVAFAKVGDAGEINVAKGYAGMASVGETMLGWYFEAGYDIFRYFRLSQGLVLFYRYERIDTQRTVPAGYEKNPANDRTVMTVGMSYFPIIQLAIKVDYQHHVNGAATGTNQWDIALAFMF